MVSSCPSGTQHWQHADGMLLPSVKKKRRKSAVVGPLHQISWWRVVLDEAQAIKNARTLAAHASRCLEVSAIPASGRWQSSGLAGHPRNLPQQEVMLSGMHVAKYVTTHPIHAFTGLNPACWSASDQSTAWCTDRGQISHLATL